MFVLWKDVGNMRYRRKAVQCTRMVMGAIRLELFNSVMNVSIKRKLPIISKQKNGNEIEKSTS